MKMLHLNSTSSHIWFETVNTMLTPSPMLFLFDLFWLLDVKNVFCSLCLPIFYYFLPLLIFNFRLDFDLFCSIVLPRLYIYLPCQPIFHMLSSRGIKAPSLNYAFTPTCEELFLWLRDINAGCQRCDNGETCYRR